MKATYPLPRLLGLALAVLALICVSGCASLGGPTPKTFEDNIALSVTSVTQVRKTAEILLAAGKISKADAQNIQQQADTAREGIALAIAIRTTDPAAAQTKLATAIQVLHALDNYLATKGTKP